MQEQRPLEEVFRQVHPLYNNKQTFYQAFLPTQSDHGKLSVDDAAKISAEKCYTLRKNRTCRSWSISCTLPGKIVVQTRSPKTGLLEMHTLVVQPKPLPDNPAHALIRFLAPDSNEKTKKAAFNRYRGRMKPVAEALARRAEQKYPIPEDDEFEEFESGNYGMQKEDFEDEACWTEDWIDEEEEDFSAQLRTQASMEK